MNLDDMTRVSTSVRKRLSERLGRVDATERQRLTGLGAALALVASAALLRIVLRIDAVSMPFLLFGIAIAVSAWYGGLWAGVTATLAAMLVVRFGAGATPGVLLPWVLFGAEGVGIALVIARVMAALEEKSEQLSYSEGRVFELESIQRRGFIVERALGHIEESTDEAAVVILDDQGAITEWRDGAARLYGHTAQDVVGAPAVVLMGRGFDDTRFQQLLDDATNGSGVARTTGVHQRADGTEFNADVEIRPVPQASLVSFTMVVRDLTRQREWAAFAKSSAQTETVLQRELDIARQQLETLQGFTDQSLNALSGPELVVALLDRLRTTIDVDGIALMRIGAFRARVFAASGGLQPQSRRPLSDLRVHQTGRTLWIQNDVARVAQSSAFVWPEHVTSLIAVPAVRGDQTEVIIEAVSQKPRRSTEWEIALIQVVAERTAGLIRDEQYADTGAVA